MMRSKAGLGRFLAIGLLVGSAIGAAPADHPIVAGFERFAVGPAADAARDGRLLLGELSCTSCHRLDEAREGLVQRKQPPILDAVGTRARPEFLRAFLADPGRAKPGTTMPNVIKALPEPERKDAVESLVHFLATTGAVTDSPAGHEAIEKGKQAYHQVGCVACHGPQEGDAERLPTSVPLGDLAAKYSLPSLTAFLQDPHKVRPSGRMPSLNLEGELAVSVASYLLRDLKVNLRPNLNYAYYEGNWKSIPDFAALKPVESGQCAGFDLTRARKNDNFAMKFEGYLRIDRAGDYTFHTTSDDGSRLWIDGQLVVDNDGIHPATSKAGSLKLAAGMHKFLAAMFEGGGEQDLRVEYEGAGLPRQTVLPALSLTEEVPPAEEEKRFRPDPALADRGRSLFGSLGCASCHQISEGGKTLDSKLQAPAFAALKPKGGCLAEAPSPGAPDYRLNALQRADLAAAIQSLASAPAAPPTPQETIARTLTTFNCYACHQRDGIGGVEEARNAFFETAQKEMGDEGRIPPALNGVGAKLTAEWIKHVLADGAKDRPYMHTRMPKFGEANVGHVAAAFEKADPASPVPSVDFTPLTPRKVKTTGRFLVGAEAFGCIKCHNFRGVQSTGVQALDMATMTRRLRHEWFTRYVVDPQAYRPGTRMPSAWPEGKTTLPKVLDGSTPKQVEAIWQFLSDGGDAAIPYGLGRDPIPLVAENEAVLYRNFIEGAGPRAIGVGYPEKANLAFDANDMRLALIWQGGFMDASRHWTGRGEGFQPPLGDNVVKLHPGPPLARLDSQTAAWPKQSAKEIGYRFLGYRLAKDRRPTFRYQYGPIRVEDFSTAVAGKDTVSLRRTLTLESPEPVENLWLRAAVGDKIEAAADGRFVVNGGEWSVKITSDAPPVVRPSEGKAELLVPIRISGRPATVVEEFQW